MDLQHELRCYSQRRDELMLTRDRLVVQHTAIAGEIAQLSGVSAAGKTDLQRVAEQVQVDSSHVSISTVTCCLALQHHISLVTSQFPFQSKLCASCQAVGAWCSVNP